VVRAQWTIETEMVRAHFATAVATTGCSVRTIDFDSTEGLFGLKPSQNKVRPVRAQLALGEFERQFRASGPEVEDTPPR
jgi:hypothetical protein